MTDFEISSYSDGALVVDSRLIAQALGIQHKNFMETIRNYQINTEQAFGQLRFETETVTNSVGAVNEVKFVYLTEDQATFLVTLSKNTPQVVRCKILLVSQFSKAKKLLREKGYYQVPHTSVYIRRLENIRDHEIADDLWSVFRESAEILLEIEQDFRVPVEQMDLCDGSIGKRWRQYRKGKPWVDEDGFYTHLFRDKRGSRKCSAYRYVELPYFKKWLRENYKQEYLPKYLVEKYGKRAVLQIYQERSMVNDYILSLTEEKRSTEKQDEMYQIFLAAREVLEQRILAN